MLNAPGYDARIAFLGAIEPVVEAVEETTQDPLVGIRIMRLEHHGTERRCQCQGDERRKRHGDSDGQCELLIEYAHHAAHKGNRHKHSRQYTGDGNDRSLYLIHSTLCSFLR